MGSSSSTCSDKTVCPVGFSCSSSGFFSTTYVCSPPTSGFPSNSVPLGGSVYNVVGTCGGGLTGTIPPLTCPAGSALVANGQRSTYCGCGFQIAGCNAGNGSTGRQYINTCKNIAPSTTRVLSMFYRSSCKDMVINGQSTQNYSPNQWCNGSGDRTKEGYCWIPYYVDSNSNCFAFDLANDGQFLLPTPDSRGIWAKGGVSLPISAMSDDTSGVVPQSAAPQVQGGHIAAVAVPVGGLAAVIGLGIFIKKRNLKKKKPDGNKGQELVKTNNLV